MVDLVDLLVRDRADGTSRRLSEAHPSVRANEQAPVAMRPTGACSLWIADASAKLGMGDAYLSSFLSVGLRSVGLRFTAR